MPYKYRRTCPICQKQDIAQIGAHLRQVHGLDRQQRQPWLRQSEVSRSQNNDEVQRVVTTPGSYSQPATVQPQMDAATYNSHRITYDIGGHWALTGSQGTLIGCQGTLHSESPGSQKPPYMGDTNFRFKHTFSMIVAAPSGFGKTHMMKKILEQADQTIDPPPQRIIWCYGQNQPMYEEM